MSAPADFDRRTGAVLRLVDANPFRDAIRDADLAKNRAKLAELAR